MNQCLGLSSTSKESILVTPNPQRPSCFENVFWRQAIPNMYSAYS